MGLVEEEWLATLSTIDEDDVTFLDFVEEGRGLAQGLKEQVCYVISTACSNPLLAKLSG